jgi:uroporphyrinogen decarboxylase
LLHKKTNFQKESYIEYILEYKKAGADDVILAEPSVAMIPPNMTGEFSNRYIEQIIDAVQDDTFSVNYHNCGAVNQHLEVIARLNAQAFHFGSDVDLNLALNTLPKDRIVMGNIDPRLFLDANGARIEKITEGLLAKYSGFDNYICSTGCDLSPNASPDMINLFLQVAQA